jgi:hypothetical protein
VLGKDTYAFVTDKHVFPVNSVNHYECFLILIRKSIHLIDTEFKIFFTLLCLCDDVVNKFTLVFDS